MAYGYFKDLARRTASDKKFHGKVFNIAKNQRNDGYQRGIIKKLLAVILKMEIYQDSNKHKNYTNQLLENSRKEKYNHFL